jgi:hypothetical protein
MKPINLDNSPCNPVSSNCVIWQGPNIPCIKLCTGDTVTDVVYELAKQLCTILDQVNISTVDLSCLKLTTGKPTNIKALLQILIDKICALNNVPAASSSPTRGVSDTIVPVAACLQTNNQTTMKLTDYVQLIGNKICSILNDITNINSSITNLTTRVIALEATPATPPYVLPSITPDCTLANGTVEAGVSYKLDVILTALVNDDNYGYCALISNTGEPEAVYQAYTSQTVDGNDGALSNCYQTLNQLYDTTWINTPQNLSESFIDLWLVVKDIRDAYKRYNVVSGSSNVTVTPTTTPGTCGPEVSYAISVAASSDPEIIVADTSAIDMTVVKLIPTNQWQIKASIKDTGWHDLLGFSQYSSSPQVARPQARRIGNMIHFRGVIQIPMGSDGGGASGTVRGINEPDAFGAVVGCQVYDSALVADPNACAIYESSGGSVTQIPAGGSKAAAMQIRFARGGNVLPSAILSGGETIDNTIVQSNTIILYRGVKLAGGSSGVFLSAVGASFVSPLAGGGCIMGFSPLRGSENFSGSFLNWSSKVRMIVSRIKTGQVVPLYDSQLAGTTNDDTSNAPAGNTAYTPNLVGNASSIVWTFDCDAGNASELGGFRYRLDGQMAFLAPCNTGTSTLVSC